MTHFGIICPAATGHLNPMTTLGYELKQRGHRVTVFSVADAEPETFAAGLEFCAIGTEKFPLGEARKSFSKLGKLSQLDAFRLTIIILQQLAITYLEEAPAAIKAAGIELLLIDRASSSGETIAEYLNLPFVTVTNSLLHHFDPAIPPMFATWPYNRARWAKWRNRLAYELMRYLGRPILSAITEYRQAWNLPQGERFSLADSPFARLAQQPPGFDFPRQNLPECLHFTGPYLNTLAREKVPFPWQKLTGQPLIYASMGTLQNRLFYIFETIAEACAGLDVQLIIALGGGSRPESLPELPGNPLVVGYAPQLELLEKATLVITHAGMNTTLESLSNGVPMVAIPIANDQPGVAARIKWTGAGEMVSLDKLNAKRLKQGIERVLTEDSYKNNACKLQAAIQRAGGKQRAVEIIEQVAATGKPVLARTSIGTC